MQTATLGPAWVERGAIRRRLFAVLSTLFVFAVIPSIGWLTATHMMKTQIGNFIDEERIQGRVWTCGNWIYSGFPFRSEAQCKDLVVLREGVSPVVVSVPQLTLNSSIFNPFRIWIEIGSPLKLTLDERTSTFAQWHAATAALQTGFGFEPDRLSVTLDEFVINDLMSRGTMKLAHGSASVQRIPDGAEISAAADFLDFAALGAPGYRAVFDGRIDRAAALLNRNGLDAFQKSGGRFLIDHLSLTRPKQDLFLKGFATITDSHRLDGAIELHATGIGTVLGGVVFNPDMDRDDIEVRLPVLITNGVLSVGPYRLGELAPLY